VFFPAISEHHPKEPRQPRTTMHILDRISQLGLPIACPEFFPPQLELYRLSLAEGADAPDEYAVAYMLAAAATAAGADVSASVQPGWLVRANMFFAVVGHKGSGKSILADKCFAQLIQHEEELRDAVARPRSRCRPDASVDDDEEEDQDEDNDGYGDDEDDDEEYDDEEENVYAMPTRRQRETEQPNPCVVVNDCTGPALLQLLNHNRRQLLVNTDELAGQFAPSNRAMWCELYDGRRRRRERVTAESGSSTLTAPYACMIGTVQPELLKGFYNSQGDDGLLDRVLLVGDGVMREAGWPRDADDPILNSAWSATISRLLRVEQYAADAIGQQVESRFTPAALEVCKGLLAQLNNLVVVLAIPNSQHGIVKKLVQHAVKLALLHRCLRWAVGEFGDRGPLGDIDADDAVAARDATLFFFGRWLRWRQELWGGNGTRNHMPMELSKPPSQDPALKRLAAKAIAARLGIQLIERIIRYGRLRERGDVSLQKLVQDGSFPGSTIEELQAACDWLVQNEHGRWCDGHRLTFTLLGNETPSRTRRPAEPTPVGRDS
jgi:energy-coupling factor transporter ATP-binding protein EcfA2